MLEAVKAAMAAAMTEGSMNGEHGVELQARMFLAAFNTVRGGLVGPAGPPGPQGPPGPAGEGYKMPPPVTITETQGNTTCPLTLPARPDCRASSM